MGDDVATVTVFVDTPTDTIGSDFSMLTYSFRYPAFCGSSARVRKRLQPTTSQPRQEDFAYHQFLIKKSRCPARPPPEPTLLAIGVPFSDRLNTLCRLGAAAGPADMV